MPEITKLSGIWLSEYKIQKKKHEISNRGNIEDINHKIQ